MGYVCQRVEVFPKDGSTWSSSGTVLTDAYGVEVKEGIGKIKNSFSFYMPLGRTNFNTTTKNLISENLVKIWMWRDTTSYTDSDLIIEGVIRSVNQDISDGGDVLSIKGDDFSEVFFDVETPLNQQDKTWVEISKQILQDLRGRNDKPIYWADSANGWTGTPNPTVKNDGTAFPRKTLILNYTKVSEMLEKLTSDEFTEDGQYLYWIEKQGTRFYLVCRYKSGSTAGTITQGTEGYQIKIQKDKEDVKNFVIYNCGSDLYGNSVEDVYYDTGSIGKIGYKTYYATEETQDLFTNAWNTERWDKAKNASFNPDADGNPQDDFPTSYPYVFTDGESVANDKAFNDYLKQLALGQGEQIATRIVDLSANPRYNIEHNTLFTNNYNKGELWQCVFPWRAVNRPLRIEEARYVIGETSLQLVEDETTAEFD